MSEFLESAPCAPAVFYRSYSRRKDDGTRENFQEAVTRAVGGIAEVGNFTDEQRELCLEAALKQQAFPSGRALWVSGSDWSRQPENFYGFYNCQSSFIDEPAQFGLLMELAMCGTGTGAVLEQDVVGKLPSVKRKLVLGSVKEDPDSDGGREDTKIEIVHPTAIDITVGDSRQGWVDAYQGLINLAMGLFECGGEDDEPVFVNIDLTHVRRAGERLKGFGGVSNPIRLRSTLERVTALLGKAYGRKLTAIEACLLIDEAASAVVAGSIRRSAGLRQFSEHDEEAALAKLGLYKQDEEGNWSVDPEREALRMANHTRTWHHKPTYQEVLDAVTLQHGSGEGAIQYAPEAVARANADLLDDPGKKKRFLKLYGKADKSAAAKYIEVLAREAGEPVNERILYHRMHRYGLNPCAEILLCDNLCNLAEVHLNRVDPVDQQAQERAFRAAALQVAALLHHHFPNERLQYSRENDPIVGVSFTGLFDFFVAALGESWLQWMMDGRPAKQGKAFVEAERQYLTHWRNIVRDEIQSYCSSQGIRTPNRYTTVQPAGSKSLLTGASPGWHPPKAQRFIRRITFSKTDPIVAALKDYGYSVIPAQSARDDEGRLLDDVNDPRVHEVLVEIPVEVPWARLAGCDKHDLSRLPIEAQWGLYMQVQRHYSTHTTSATLEIRESEIETLAKLIYDDIRQDGGYMSAALLARFDDSQTFPRLPFEPIDLETYERLHQEVLDRRITDDISLSLSIHDDPAYNLAPQDGACTNGACVFKADMDEARGVT
jgi:ribonucleotide reductase class II